MPELAAIGAVGAFVTFLLANLNFYFVHKSFSQPKLKILNSNLAKIGWFWSMDQANVIPLESDKNIESQAQMDYQKATRGAFIFGTIMLFMSWLGFIILTIYMVSIYKLVKNRTEIKIMASDLANKEIQDTSLIKQLLLEKAEIKPEHS